MHVDMLSTCLHVDSEFSWSHLRTRSVVQRVVEPFWDRVSPTKMIVWRNFICYTTDGSCLHLNTLIIFKKSLSRIQKYQQERIVWTLVRVHLTESLNAI